MEWSVGTYVDDTFKLGLLNHDFTEQKGKQRSSFRLVLVFLRTIKVLVITSVHCASMGACTFMGFRVKASGSGIKNIFSFSKNRLR